MSDAEFWQFVAQAKTIADGDLALLQQELSQKAQLLPDAEVVSLHQHIWTFLAQSYQSRLWAAAYLINGGCSDDGFDYFRGWLIAQGREVYFAALENPDSLADVISQIPDWQPYDELEFEDMLGIASSAYEKRHGEYPQIKTPFPALQLDWEEDDNAYFALHFPKLFALMQLEEDV